MLREILNARNYFRFLIRRAGNEIEIFLLLTQKCDVTFSRCFAVNFVGDCK